MNTKRTFPKITFLGHEFELHLNGRALHKFRQMTGDDPVGVLFDLINGFETDDEGNVKLSFESRADLPIEWKHVEALAFCLLKSKRRNPIIGDPMDKPTEEEEFENFLEEFDFGLIQQIAPLLGEMISNDIGPLDKKTEQRPTAAA